jgi:hypothetical protein
MLALISSLCLCNAFAYHLEISPGNLEKTDTVSFHVKTVNGDCKIINGSYNCTKTESNLSGLPLEHLQDVVNFKNSTASDQNLVEFSLKINGKAFASCQRLEKSNGQNIKVTLSKTGCV